MPSIQVITLGCSKNTVDTEHLLAQLPVDAFTIMPEDWTGPVDYLLLNTCGFIGDAKEESVNAILSQAVRRRGGEVGKLIVFGCLSQRYASDLPSLIPEVDAWFGARDIFPVVRALGVEPSAQLRNSRRFTPDGRAYAYIKISEDTRLLQFQPVSGFLFYQSCSSGSPFLKQTSAIEVPSSVPSRDPFPFSPT